MITTTAWSSLVVVVRQNNKDRTETASELGVDLLQDRLDLRLGEVGGQITDGLHVSEGADALLGRIRRGS